MWIFTKFSIVMSVRLEQPCVSVQSVRIQTRYLFKFKRTAKDILLCILLFSVTKFPYKEMSVSETDMENCDVKIV